VALMFGLPSTLLALMYDPAALAHTALEYAAFIALMGSLFAISGGVRVAGSLAGTPLSNTALLALGAVLANLVGTTGASMLLIRPYLRANRRRSSRVHQVLFFIFIVANCGGLLTPLGDPPLFLGFLHGVPFQWTLRLWKEWLTVVLALLVLFNFMDQYLFHRQDVSDHKDLDEEVEHHAPLRLQGTHNLALLLGVVVTVLTNGFLVHPRFGAAAGMVFQALVMVLLAFVSIRSTPRKIREDNEFSWHPFLEVAILFAAIFIAMIPALAVLRSRGEALGADRPWEFLWAAGSLSAVLDNAPTYLAFLSLAQHLPDEVVGTTHAALSGIACGSVLFGALTYIGNGPNFMVKTIAEHAGVRMPSFFGYVVWSAGILLPIFVVITFLFFR
jgi:Na+/H+ antiporter NhaD/arsenite permease-like protein